MHNQKEQLQYRFEVLNSWYGQ